MKKKSLYVVLACLVAFSFTACGDPTQQTESSAPDVGTDESNASISSEPENAQTDTQESENSSNHPIDHRDVWHDIENSYYNATKSSTFDLVDDGILMGSEIVDGSMVKCYTSENLNTISGIDQFIKGVNEVGLMSVLKDENTYFATVEGTADSIPGTAIIFDHVVTQVMEQDNGAMYRFDFDAQNKENLATSELVLQETKAYFVILDGFMQGIVLDDTNTQMIKPISSYMDILDLDKVYRLEEILTILHDQKDILTESETIHQNLDPEKPNIELG